MTEDEARKKWCPFRQGEIIERIGHDCVGSACMAWRNQDDDFEKAFAHRPPFSVGRPNDAIKPDGDGWTPETNYYPSDDAKSLVAVITAWRRPRNGRQGYCGLAGAPQ